MPQPLTNYISELPPRLYILCGLPFAGKSTLARGLVARRGFACVSLDEINAERGVGLDGQPIASHEWARSYALSYRRLDRVLAAGQPTIYDATSFTRKQRDRLRDIAAAHGVRATVIYLDVPEDEVQGRWQDNRRSGQRYDVRDEDFAQVKTNFQPPTADEDVIYFDGSLSLEQWIERNFP